MVLRFNGWKRRFLGSGAGLLFSVSVGCSTQNADRRPSTMMGSKPMGPGNTVASAPASPAFNNLANNAPGYINQSMPTNGSQSTVVRTIPNGSSPGFQNPSQAGIQMPVNTNANSASFSQSAPMRQQVQQVPLPNDGYPLQQQQQQQQQSTSNAGYPAPIQQQIPPQQYPAGAQFQQYQPAPSMQPIQQQQYQQGPILSPQPQSTPISANPRAPKRLPSSMMKISLPDDPKNGAMMMQTSATELDSQPPADGKALSLRTVANQPLAKASDVPILPTEEAPAAPLSPMIPAAYQR